MLAKRKRDGETAQTLPDTVERRGLQVSMK